MFDSYFSIANCRNGVEHRLFVPAALRRPGGRVRGGRVHLRRGAAAAAQVQGQHPHSEHLPPVQPVRHPDRRHQRQAGLQPPPDRGVDAAPGAWPARRQRRHLQVGIRSISFFRILFRPLYFRIIRENSKNIRQLYLDGDRIIEYF